MDTPLTQISDRRRRIVEFVEQYRDEHDEGPTYEEIGEHEGVTAETAYYHAQKLIEDGYLTRLSGVIRSLRVVDQ